MNAAIKEYLSLGLICLLALLAGFWLYNRVAEPTDTVNGRAAANTANTEVIDQPSFTLKNLAGESKSSNDWAGQYQLVNFWATWCPPCVKEIPLLNAAQADFAPQGLQVIGIAVDQADAVSEFLTQYPVDYPVLLVDAMQAGTLMADYGNAIGALPYSVLLSPDGETLFQTMGELEEASLKQQLAEFLPSQ